MNKERFNNIEILRVIGCIAIIMFHFFNNDSLNKFFPYTYNYYDLFCITINGEKAVDLFFIISGVFFAIKYSSISVFEFIKKKVLRLWPVLIWVMFLSLLISFTGAIKFTLYDNILTLLGLSGTGLILKLGNVGWFWYVSAMLWVMTLFKYLLQNYNKKNVNLFISISVFLAYIFILHAMNGKIAGHKITFAYIFNIGILRAMGGIGIGYLVGEWYKNNCEKIKQLQLSLTNKIILTVIEYYCLFFVIYNLMLHKLRYHNQFIFIIFFAATIILFLIKKGFVSNALNNSFCAFLGKYTYSFYMTHLIIIQLIKGTIWKHQPWLVFDHPLLNIILPFTAIFILGIMTYHFVEKPANDYITKKLLR